jgi:hypothetical protein
VGEHIGEVNEETLIGSEALKNFNALLSVDFASILDCDFSYKKHVLTVALQEIVETLKRVLLTEASKVFN